MEDILKELMIQKENYLNAFLKTILREISQFLKSAWNHLKEN